MFFFFFSCLVFSCLSFSDGTVPPVAVGAVLFRSERMPDDAPFVKGHDFNIANNKPVDNSSSSSSSSSTASTTTPPVAAEVDYEKLFKSYLTTGFQGTNLGLAIEEINRMLRWRLSDEPLPEGEEEDESPVDRSKVKATIFLGYTSNMVSSGLREIIRFLAQHKLISCIVTSCGGIEEDFMKCSTKHYMGDFHYPGKELRVRGLNRIGNLIVPNINYCEFEKFINPILDDLLQQQLEKGRIFSPSDIIARLGKEINNEESIYYWCWKNKIPVFCPAITDGSIGDMIYFHSCAQEDKSKRLIVDIGKDICRLNELALLADKSGQIILGGGVVKHHICNANLMRNGADFSVYVNTGFEYDGSDAGAAPDEAVSWGKIRLDAKPVKVWGDATIIFPIIVSQTFAKYHYEQVAKEQAEKAQKAEKKN